MKAENTALCADTRVNHADVLAEDGDGRVFQTTAPYGTIYNFFDPYGLVFFNERTYPGSAKRKPMEWVEYDDFGDVIERDLFTAADCTYADSTVSAQS